MKGWNSENLKGWNSETGFWCKPSKIWDIDFDVPENAPDDWLSEVGGNFYIGISFHISPFTIVEGSGSTAPNFFLSRIQDPYNSWGVNAVKKEFINSGCMEHWDWLPGITVYDDTTKYTLPSDNLSAFAGTEWADNDRRIFHGIFCNETRNSLVSKYLEAINNITGPRFSGWPFGRRQLKDAVFIWIHSETKEIHAMLLASIVQSGDKFSFFNSALFDPGSKLGSWKTRPSTWDCRQVLKFLYKSRLLLADGFYEIALVAASSAVETAFYEIVLYLENNDVQHAKKLIKQNTFRDRAKKLIKRYGHTLPSPLFDKLTSAYKARNSIAHELNSYSHEMAVEHIDNLEAVIEWYYKNV